MPAAAARSRPQATRARTRGPVALLFAATLGLVFIALTAWFLGLVIEAVGSYTIWKHYDPVSHSRRIAEQDFGYIAAAPRSLLVGDTAAFARKLTGWVAAPYEKVGLVAAYQRLNAPAAAAQPAQPGTAQHIAKPVIGGGLRGATDSILKSVAKWAMVSMNVAADVLLRMSVALFALPAFLLACIVGTVDGLVRRDLRRWRGGRESSFVYHHAKHYTAWALTGGFGLYLAWPFGGFNPAYMVLVFAVLVAATLSTTVAAFKKYI